VLILRVVSKVKHESLRLLPSAHCLTKSLAPKPDLPSFHELICTQAVQVREGDLPDELIKSLSRLAATRFNVFEMVENIPAVSLVFVGEVRHTCCIFDMHLTLIIAVDTELPLESLCNRIL